MIRTLVSILLAAAIALSVTRSAHAQQSASAEEFGSRRPGLIVSGAALSVAGVAGLVASAIVLRGDRSKTKDAVGTGVAVLGGILLPLGLSLIASGTQQVPAGTTTPRDTTMMVSGGLLSVAGGVALGGGTALVARSHGDSIPGFLLLGGGNALIAVGLPLWIRGAQRVESESVGTQVQSLQHRPVTAF